MKDVKNSLVIAAGLAFAAALTMGGCIAVPVGDAGYASPGPYGSPSPYGSSSAYGSPSPYGPGYYDSRGPVVVVPVPFPHIWIGPGYYGGRYYSNHPHYPPPYR